jgi:hypothetical protein
MSPRGGDQSIRNDALGGGHSAARTHPSVHEIVSLDQRWQAQRRSSFS